MRAYRYQTVMLSQSLFGNLGVFRRRLVEKCGGFCSDLESKPDYDLVLRCAAELQAQQIRHVARVFYHRYDDGIAAEAGTLLESHDSNGRGSTEQFLHKNRVRATGTPARKRGSIQVGEPPPPPLPPVS